MAFAAGFFTHFIWLGLNMEPISTARESARTHSPNDSVDLDILQARGKLGYELRFMPNMEEPFSGYARRVHSNGQTQLLFHFENGRAKSARGWHFNGDPTDSLIEDGKGFIMETDDPEVGFFYENGLAIAYKGKCSVGKPYRHSFRDGSQISYHRKGIKRESARYLEGLRHGYWRTWNSEGILIKEMQYEKGKAEGFVREWHDNGTPKEIIAVKGGKPNGLWTEYDEDGSLLRVMNYSHGKAEGKWKSFHRTGGLRFEGNFVNDKKQGVCSWWEENGHLKYSKIYAKGTPAH